MESSESDKTIKSSIREKVEKDAPRGFAQYAKGLIRKITFAHQTESSDNFDVVVNSTPGKEPDKE